MKHSIKIWLVIILCVCHSIGYLSAQNNPPKLSFTDSLEFYRVNDNLLGYLAVLDDFHNYHLKNKAYENIKNISTYYQLFRLPRNPKERKKARYTFTLHAFAYYKYIGDNISALKYYELAHANLEDKSQGDDISWYVENVLGNIYTRLEEYERANYYLNIVEQYLELTSNFNNLSRLYVNKSRSLNAQGYLKQSINVLDRAKQLTRNEKSLAGIYLNLVDLMLATNKIDSSQIYLDSFDLLKHSFKQERQYYYYELLGDKYVKEKKYELAQAAYDQSFEELVLKLGSSQRREHAKLLNKKSKAYLRAENYVKSEKALHEAFAILHNKYDKSIQVLPTRSLIYPENTYYELFFQYAQLSFEKYRKNKSVEDLYIAQKSVNLGLYTNRMLGYSYFTTPSKMISIKQNKMLVDVGFDILYELYKAEGPEKWLNKVNELFDFSKSLNLVDKISRVNHLSTLDAELIQTVSDIHYDLRELYDEKAKDVEEARSYVLDSLIFSKEDEIKNTYGFREGQIKYLLNDLPLFIEYVITSNYVYSIENVGGQISFKRNGKVEDLEQMHREFNELISNRNDVKSQDVLRKLYDFLLGDIEMKDKEIYFIPDGIISTIPFDILKGKDNKYLIFNNTIFYALHKYQLTQAGVKRNIVRNIYCLNPDYSGRDVTSKERGELYGLEYAGLETDIIKELYPQAYFEPHFLRKDSVILKLKEANVFHFSGHAIAEKDDAYLILTREGEDNVSFSDIVDQDLDLELVVLSACETGLGELSYGDGLQSLSRAFVQAGTKTVVSTLWTVNDKATSKISSSFYESLKEGMAIDAALRAAKLDYLSDSPIETQHPYYWSSFIGIGSKLPLEVISSPNNNRYLSIVIFVFLVVAMVLYLSNKKE